MSKFSRIKDLTAKAWSYLLVALEHPSSLGPALWRALRGVHVGEFLKLNRSWLKCAGVGTVIDVGAHKGEFASAVGSLIPDVKIYSFEPLPDCFERLQVRLSRIPRCKAFNVAIGDERGEVEFWRSRITKSSSILRMDALHQQAFPWTADTSPTKVSVRRLDDYLPVIEFSGKVLLKVDVQGYEDRVLRGASQLLAHVDYVVAEVSFRPLYEGQASFEDVYSRLQSAGFSYAGNLDQLRSPVDDSILQADAFFVAARSKS